jgi:hypothetical protein
VKFARRAHRRWQSTKISKFLEVEYQRNQLIENCPYFLQFNFYGFMKQLKQKSKMLSIVFSRGLRESEFL